MYSMIYRYGYRYGIEEDVCSPRSSIGWAPRTNYFKFVLREKAGDDLVNLNVRVKDVGDAIDNVISELRKIETAMGENCGTLSSINGVCDSLQYEKEELVKYTKSLIDASQEVIGYIYNNKREKYDDALEVQKKIQSISLYEG